MRSLWMLVLVLLIAATGGILGLHDDPLYVDEVITTRHIGAPGDSDPVIATVQSVGQYSPQHAPGYFVALNLWHRISGSSPAALRYFSVLLGLLTIAVIYRIGHDLIQPQVGVYAALFTSLSVMYLFYMHEMRMYMLLLLLSACTMWLYFRLIHHPAPPPSLWVGLSVSTILLMYTNYFAVFTLAGLAAYHLLRAPKTWRWWGVVGVVVVAGMSFLPWLAVLQTAVRVETSTQEPALGPIELLSTLFITLSNSRPILMGVLLVASGWAAHKKWKTIWSFWLMFVVALMAFVWLNMETALIAERHARYFLATWVPLAILLGSGLAFLSRFRFVSSTVMGLWCVGAVAFAISPQLDIYTNRAVFYMDDYPPYPQIVDALQQSDLSPEAGEKLVVIHDMPEYIYEAYNAGHFYYDLLQMDGELQRYEDFLSVERDDFSWMGETVVWVATNLEDISPEIDSHLNEVFANYDRCDVAGGRRGPGVQAYVIKPLGCDLLDIAQGSIAQYTTEAITLLDVDQMLTDQQLDVGVTWRVAPSVPIHTYTTSLQLYVDGEMIAQQDTELLIRDRMQSVATFDLTPYEDGSYELIAIVYDWETQERLTAVLADNGTLTTDIRVIAIDIQGGEICDPHCTETDTYLAMDCSFRGWVEMHKTGVREFIAEETNLSQFRDRPVHTVQTLIRDLREDRRQGAKVFIATCIRR